MTRQQAITRHTELLHIYDAYCTPNRDYLPDGMLYYSDEECDDFLFGVDSHDPVKIIPVLEQSFKELFT